MTSGEKAEPERSAISSTECRNSRLGEHCPEHDPCCYCHKAKPECEHPNKYNYGFASGPPGIRYFYCSGCKAKWEEEDEPEKPALMCTCGCPKSSHMGKPTGCQKHAFHAFRCDHTRCGWKPREEPESSTECEGGCRIYTEPPCRDPAKCSCAGEWWKHGCKHSLPPARHCEGCGYPHIPGNHTCGHATDEAGCCACQVETEPRCTCGPDEACGDPCTPAPEDSEEHDFVSPAHCAACMRSWLPSDSVPAAEPPLTPGEEEELSLTENDIDRMAAEGEPVELIPPPPQPDRRPPYLLAYSVQGHLYEVALPGDATVAALDGRLVITHHLGPVAGICQIAPITSEESA